MASYAALVSLMNLVEQIQKHPSPPITLNGEQAQSLTKKVAFLQDFLEAYNVYDGDEEVDRLRSRIADAAYAAEDVIESHIVDQIRAQSMSHGGEKSCPADFYQDLQKVIEGMDFIEKEVVEIKGKLETQGQLLQKISATPVVLSESPSTEKNTMVGFDDVLIEMLHKLTGQESHRQIISISGMGGIGKTTLARNIYTNKRIKDRFDVLTWVTISQDYSIREILLCLQNEGIKERLSRKSEQDLGLQLYQSLTGRRYLIIMDDMWSVEAWDNVKFFFPDNNNGSRIVITTRMSKLAEDLHGSGLEMSFLNGDESWDLFCKIGFGEHGCPDELEQIAKRIANNCKGLPLSIVVIGGLVAKSKQTQENLEYIAENLNSVVNLDNNERCLKILRTSYNQLPIHLKPCFLYMGSFPKDMGSFHKDGQIFISELIMQWIAEGFLKPNKTKSLEETAEEYLTDLIERNLILAITSDCSEKPFSCKIHDLLRDLCLREARKEKFLYVITSQPSLDIISQEISTQRRIAILESTSEEDNHPQVLHGLESASRVRSLICHFDAALPLPDFRLLRLLKVVGSREKKSFLADIDQLINARYLFAGNYFLGPSPNFSFTHQFWNLQALIFASSDTTLSEFWMIPLLMHVKFRRLWIPNPGNGQMDKQDGFVLENLQTLSGLTDFKLSEEVVKRIPNIKDLQIRYDDVEGFDVASHYCLNNLGCLHKLETLHCCFKFQVEFDFRNNMSFPNSLKELTLSGSKVDWEDVNIKIGSLPFLQRLIV